MSLILSLVATAISLPFAGVVYRQYIDRWRPYQLVWSVALRIFALGAFCQFVAERNGWTPGLAFVFVGYLETMARRAARAGEFPASPAGRDPSRRSSAGT